MSAQLLVDEDIESDTDPGDYQSYLSMTRAANRSMTSIAEESSGGAARYQRRVSRAPSNISTVTTVVSTDCDTDEEDSPSLQDTIDNI